MAEPSTPEHWQGVLVSLRTQLADRLAKTDQLTAKKRQLSLAAMTGDEAAKRRLGTINRELVELKVNIEDVEAAVGEAQAQLVEAEAERQAEHQRRVRISNMCEKRIEIAEKIDAEAGNLGGLLAELDAITGEMRLERQGDASFVRQTDPVGRVRAAMLTVLPMLYAGESAPTRDVRRGRPLAELERESLAPFVLSEQGKERSAA
jgi:hypothetical protein